MAARPHHPKGPGGTWVTGQRVPESGYWVNQFGQFAHMEFKSTFPPRLGRHNGFSSNTAFWRRVEDGPAATGLLF